MFVGASFSKLTMDIVSALFRMSFRASCNSVQHICRLYDVSGTLPETCSAKIIEFTYYIPQGPQGQRERQSLSIVFHLNQLVAV